MARPNPSNLLMSALRWSVPGWAVLAFFAASGMLSATAAILGGGVAFAATCALAWRRLALLTALQQRLEHIQQSGGLAVEPATRLNETYAAFAGAGVISDIAGTVQRLERSWGRERQALIEGLQSAALLFDALPDPLVTLDRNTRIVYANASARALLAAGDAETLTGRDLSAVLRQPALLDAAAEVLAGASPRNVEFTRPDRVEQIFEARLEPIADDTVGEDDARVVMVLRDVTSMRRSERMRADFVANVSHELRTPLSSLIGFIETLRGPARDDPDARERFLELMQTQATRMSRLVADLLSLSRIEMNEHTLPRDLVSLKPLIESVVDLLAPRARARRVRLELKIDPVAALIPGSGEELTQLFQNLVENAIKYCDEDSAVRIVGERQGDRVSVSVVDSGDGIAREHLPRLTERFYRVDTARSRELGGTGLGLAIVKHIVNRHRGELKIRSELGVGSTFEVILPTALPVRASVAVRRTAVASD
jgi:two-component system phosphate regulon sensor histidine kinase PhoR